MKIFFFIYLSFFFRKSDVYIYHVVWYCDTCLSVVYGTRTQNSSTIQLYEIQSGNNDNIVFKSRHTEETKKGGLLPRFLKPFFSPRGEFAFIIRFDSSNPDKMGYKAHPHIARIHFNQLVSRFLISSMNNLGVFFYSIHKLMRNHHRIFMLMKLFMLIN